MQAPNIPAGETERLTDLHSYEVLDTASDATLDAITELAAQILDVPIALITTASRASTIRWATPQETRC